MAMTGMNTLNACAAPLFALIRRIRNRAQHVDPDKLRQSVVAEVRAFESRALSAQIDPQNVKVARYALCATLDDVVLNTPWGGQSGWAMQSMVGTFHRETVGGDRFYDLLARLEKDAASNIDLLEFLYTCLSLGFEGRLQGRGSRQRKASCDPAGAGADHPRPARRGRARPVAALERARQAAQGAARCGSRSGSPSAPWRRWRRFRSAALSFALGQRANTTVDALAALDNGSVAVLERKAPPPPPPPPTPVDGGQDRRNSPASSSRRSRKAWSKCSRRATRW